MARKAVFCKKNRMPHHLHKLPTACWLDAVMGVCRLKSWLRKCTNRESHAPIGRGGTTRQEWSTGSKHCRASESLGTEAPASGRNPSGGRTLAGAEGKIGERAHQGSFRADLVRRKEQLERVEASNRIATAGGRCQASKNIGDFGPLAGTGRFPEGRV